jgi:hypothetical protein
VTLKNGGRSIIPTRPIPLQTYFCFRRLKRLQKRHGELDILMEQIAVHLVPGSEVIMSVVKQDSVGIYVQSGGYIARPIPEYPTRFKVGENIKTKHFGGSVIHGVGKHYNCKPGQYMEYWLSCGDYGLPHGPKGSLDMTRAQAYAWYLEYHGNELRVYNAVKLNSYRNYCTCGGFAGPGMNQYAYDHPEHPHRMDCAQYAEFEERAAALNLAL